MADLPELVKPYPDAPFPYDPANNQWALYPLAAKRSLHEGDYGADVLYLNDALRLRAGQNTCGDVFNPATRRGVRNVRSFFKVDPGVSHVDQKLWGLIDWLVTGERGR